MPERQRAQAVRARARLCRCSAHWQLGPARALKHVASDIMQTYQHLRRLEICVCIRVELQAFGRSARALLFRHDRPMLGAPSTRRPNRSDC